MTPITLNGRQVEPDADPATPLLWVLRTHVGLVGTKFGRGVAQCGYGQSGQVMGATALPKRQRRPSDAHIDAAIQRLHRGAADGPAPARRALAACMTGAAA